MSLPSSLPTPVEVPAGHIVRVRLGGHCYHSGFLAPALAAQQAELLDQARRDRIQGAESVLFTTADGRTVRINARSISAIESGPPPSHWRDRPDLDQPIELVPAEPHAYPLVPGGLSRADLEAAGYTVAVPSSAGHPDRGDDDLNLGAPRRPSPATMPKFPPSRPRPVRDNPQA